ncbi:MAG: HAD family hydrolase [Nanoarchaeota archaeon]
MVTPPNKNRLAFLFDVDGVILDSPHEETWRSAALEWNLFSEDFDFKEFYQNYIAGLPGLKGAEIILEKTSYFKNKKIKDKQEKEIKAKEFRIHKQKFLDEYISKGKFKVFEDIVSLIRQAKGKVPIVAVSSSENSEKMLRKIGLLEFFDSTTLGAIKYRVVNKENLYAFAFGKLCGKMKIQSSTIPVVFEDADKGVKAAKDVGYICIGIAREGLATPQSLIKIGADLAYDNKTLLKKGYSGIIQDIEHLNSGININ